MKGICFIEPLFYATVDGRKTQTRRGCNPQPDKFIGDTPVFWKESEFENHFTGEQMGEYVPCKPRYNVGDVLFLKEPYYNTFFNGIVYKFDNNPHYYDVKWNNKLFMPSDAARHFIKITSVRLERLQKISDDDCKREGINRLTFGRAGMTCFKEDYVADGASPTPRMAYAILIDKINGRGTWESDKFVWVYDYVKCDKNGQTR